jgi:phage terminase large subunit GpA-like protein
MLVKEFPGGVLVMTGANSAVGLRSMPARYLFLDEVDAYPPTVGGEGNPLDLAERAARTFGRRRKIFVVSTPLRKMVSHITAAFNDCEQVFDYHVPCPHCGRLQPFVWEQMRWTLPAGFEFTEDQKGRLRSIPGVTYECVSCRVNISEHHKTQMLTWGKWIARWDRGSHSAGFFLNALYSPVGWFSWGEAAAMFERAKKDITKEQVFVNTILGLGYEEPSEAPDWEHLFARRETYRRGVVPPGVRFLTAGVDHQEDRVEVTVIGWGREKRSWVVDHLVLPCPPKLADRKRVLDELVGTDWPCAGGGSLPLWCIAVDSGAYTLDVYAWARAHQRPSVGGSQVVARQPRTVLITKGMDRWGAALLPPQKAGADERKRGGLQVIGLGTSGMKRGFYLWLRQRPPSPDERAAGGEEPYGFCHFPLLEEEYFRQLTAERLVKTRTKQGYDKEQWVKTRDRNEALDCWILAWGAAIASGLDRMRERDWERVEADLPAGLLAAPAPAPAMPTLPAGGVTESVVVPPPPPPKPPAPGGGRMRRRLVRSSFIGRLR